jgi:hypothetical protein
LTQSAAECLVEPAKIRRIVDAIRQIDVNGGGRFDRRIIVLLVERDRKYVRGWRLRARAWRSTSADG